MAKGKFVSYLRVSTDKQGRSGLGFEAQRAAVKSYLDGGRWTLAAEYVEAESGKRSDRGSAGLAWRRPRWHRWLSRAREPLQALDGPIAPGGTWGRSQNTRSTSLATSERNRSTLRDDVVHRVQKNGDPWRLSEELPPPSKGHSTPNTKGPL
jgi:Resolvase, N terminal domain